MLHNEARNLLVEAYEKTHDAKAVALACGISVPTVGWQSKKSKPEVSICA